MKNLGRWNCAEEKFTALCLPGMLPGFYQSYNNKGFAYCVNTISTGIRPTDSQTRNYICTSIFDYEHTQWGEIDFEGECLFSLHSFTIFSRFFLLKR